MLKPAAFSAAQIKGRTDAAALPFVEIPLYQGYIRSSAHQLVCLPEAQWLALSAQSPVPYAPESIDRATVLRIAHRIARVFNAPPMAAAGASAQGVVPAFEQVLAGLQCMPTVWSCHPATLTRAGASCHGMDDRLENEYGQAKNTEQPNHMRFSGFSGVLRLQLENNEVWRVALLAPSHFVRRLMFYSA